MPNPVPAGPAAVPPCDPCADNQPRAQSIRKGTYEMNAVFTGLTGELVAVLTKDKCGIASASYPCATLAVHDGSTAGGHLLMRRDFGCYIPGSLPSGIVPDGLIDTRTIADGAVTAPKLADGAVTAPKLADGAVTNDKIANGCQQSLVDRAVDSAKQIVTFIGRRDTPPDYRTPVPFTGGAIVRVRNAGDRVRFADNVRIEGGCLHVNYNPSSEEKLHAATVQGIITAWNGRGALQFRIAHNGAAYANGPYSGSGADYAERFESLSGERIAPGTSVALEAGKVRAATQDDDPETIVGVIRPEGAAGMVGNDAALNWAGKYLTDAYGAPLTVTRSVWRWFDEDFDTTRAVPADGFERPQTAPEQTVLTEIVEPALNPAFDPDRPYVPRSERPEWAVVGLLGQIPIANGQPVHPRWRLMSSHPIASVWLVR